MKYDLEILEEYIKKGLVEVQSHPRLPLKVYKYSRKCQYESVWDEITLNMRGTILDLEGNLVARGFSKFFNYEEITENIPWGEQIVWIQEKLDGSCGILFHYENEWIMATNGSFTSNQAIKGLEIIKSNYDLGYFDKNLTYVVEIIYKENKIVVDYGDEEKVVFLTIFNKNRELSVSNVRSILLSQGVPTDNLVSSELFLDSNEDLAKSLKNKNIPNSEGYVLRFQPSNFRLKIKFDDYVRVHKFLQNFSILDIWECLKNNQDISQILDNIPDEFDSWVKEESKKLIKDFKHIDYFSNFVYNTMKKNKYDRKDFANNVKQQDKKIHSILFRMFDDRKYDDLIWNLIKPKKLKPTITINEIVS